MSKLNQCIIQLKNGKFLKLSGPFEELERIQGTCVLFKSLKDFQLKILKPSVTEEYFLTGARAPVNLSLRSEEPFESYKARFDAVIKELESERLLKAVIATEKIYEASALPKLNSLETNDDRLIFFVQNEDSVFFGATPDEFLEISKDNVFALYSVAGTSLSSSVDKEENEVSVASALSELKKFEINTSDVVHSIVRSGVLYHGKTILRFRANIELLSSLIEALYPPSTIFGYPTDSAFKIKDLLKPPSGYGYYGSLLGVFGDFGDGLIFRSVCMIRGLEVKNNLVRVVAGSGVIKNRSAEQEFEECQLKLKSILDSVGTR